MPLAVGPLQDLPALRQAVPPSEALDIVKNSIKNVVIDPHCDIVVSFNAFIISVEESILYIENIEKSVHWRNRHTELHSHL